MRLLKERGLTGQTRETGALVRSHMNEVSQVEIILFSVIHFLVRDDNYVILQSFARLEKYQGLFGLAMFLFWFDPRFRQNIRSM